MSTPKKKEMPDPLELVQAVLGKAGAVAWNDLDGTPHVTVRVAGHPEHLPIDGTSFNAFLTVEYLKESRLYSKSGSAPAEAVVRSTQNLLRARAIESRRSYEAFVRFAYFEGRIYYDLGDEERRVVVIDTHGFQVVPSSAVPVRFVRPPGTLASPAPTEESDGSAFSWFEDFLGLERSHFVLVVSFILSCLNPAGIYPILVLQGGQGTGKTTLARLLGRLVDPRSVQITAPPSSEENFVVSAMESHLYVMDNLSGVKAWLSDAVCRTSTGGGFLTRKLFTNRGVERFSKTMPVIVNGIEAMTNRNDLADRSIEVHLPPLEGRRSGGMDIDKAFEAARPALLGALFASLSRALAGIEAVQLGIEPRMLDFARWVKAAEPALPFEPGEFERVYSESIVRAAVVNVEGDEVASAVVSLVDGGGTWEGSMSDLLKALTPFSPALSRVSARKLTSMLERASPALKRLGYTVSRLDRSDPTSRRTLYRIERKA